MQRVKLASVLLQAEDYLSDDTELLYIEQAGSACSYDVQEGSLRVSGTVDFATYFNSVSVVKWKRYTAIDNIKLHIELAGAAGTIAVRALRESDTGALEDDVPYALDVEASPDFKAYEIEMPLDCAVAGFALSTGRCIRVRSAYYFTELGERTVRPVCLALCTTTFRKEEFIVPNIARIRAGILEGDEDLARDFHMFVVDNGRTLDADSLSGNGVTIIPNPNVGGAGGFARGMMVALESDRAFTHVVLMDDDVRMQVESFRRLHALLSLVTPAYEQACVNGAMLQLEHPSVQFEDIAFVRRIGGYQKVKPTFDMREQANMVRNELIDVEVENTYGAWWFSCIPVELVRQAGLPMPFFIRCDDVEYGLRCRAPYMTMNGICVWHAQFTGRFNAAIVCYQYARNMTIVQALHGASDERMQQLQFWRMFRYYLRTMDYAAADLWLDGLEDYLKGPEFLMQVNAIATVKANSAKAEQFKPIGDLDPDIMGKLEINLDWLESGEHTPLWQKIANTLPHDRHYLPDFLLSETPGMLAPGAGECHTPWRKTAMRKHLVAMSLDGKQGAIRTIDRARYKSLVARYRRLMREYRARGAEVAQSYRDRIGDMTSLEFWHDYLVRQDV